MLCPGLVLFGYDVFMNAELFDTHCHLTFKGLADRAEQVLVEAAGAGVSRVVTIACTAGDLEPAVTLARRHERVWVAAGIHPHEAGRTSEEDLARFARAWRDEDKVVAAGEMGLDYHYDFSPRQVQQDVFARQLEMVAPTGLPLVIHSRKAHDDTVRILTEQGFVDKKVVFHCFSGTADEVAELRACGWQVSFTGVITFKNAGDLRSVCADTPLDEIMFETDAPYLSPEPIRKKRPNVPAYLIHTVRLAAELHGVSFETMAEASTANALRFFALAQNA